MHSARTVSKVRNKNADEQHLCKFPLVVMINRNLLLYAKGICLSEILTIFKISIPLDIFVEILSGFNILLLEIIKMSNSVKLVI